MKFGAPGCFHCFSKSNNFTSTATHGEEGFFQDFSLFKTLKNFDLPFCKSNPRTDCETVTKSDVRLFSYNELKAATRGFANKIGQGGFGSVYKGRLVGDDLIAVKVLSVELESLRGEREFISEVTALSDIRRENLVSLRGCCIHGAQRFLVYGFIQNNSLSHTFLGDEQKRLKFTWALRKQVSLGNARGLCYLHEEVRPHIVHRDIKGSNILLDQNFIPKIADFGLAKLFMDNMSHISTRVAGTFFGVLLLEIVSGRPVLDYDLKYGEQFIVEKAWELYNSRNLEELVDFVIKEDYSRDEATRFLRVGLFFVQETTKLRPEMSTVVKMLTGEIDAENVEISRPGIVADLMAVKIRGQISSSIFSSPLATGSTGSSQA